jgi:hypothetical protein
MMWVLLAHTLILAVHTCHKYNRHSAFWILQNMPQIWTFCLLDTNDDHNTDGKLKIKNENQKKRAYAAMAGSADVTNNISVEMKVTNRLAQESVDAVEETNRLAQESVDAVKQKNQLAKQSQIIAIAQHLGKDAMLEDLLALLSSSSG